MPIVAPLTDTIARRTTSSPDRAAAGRAMEAMLQMVKIDIAKLEEAYAGGTP